MFKDNPPKNKVIIFALLVVLNIVIRIPSIPHEKGSDSFFVHSLANSITMYGQANWWESWLSIFGLYPLSYASGIPYFLSGISQLANIDMEITILVFSLVLGIFSLFASYLLGNMLYPDSIFKYIFAFLFSVSQGVLIFTTWEVSTRGPFIALFPLFLYLLLKFSNGSRLKIGALLLMLLILLFSIHKFSYFAALSLGLMVFLLLTRNRIKIPSNLQTIGYTALFSFFMLLPFFKRSLVPFAGSRYDWILEIFIVQVRHVGPLTLLVFGGLVYMLLKQPKRKEESFILLLCAFLLPIIYSDIYGHFVYLIFSILLVSIALTNILNVPSKHFKTFAILLLICSVSFSGFYNHWRTGESAEEWVMDDKTYVSAKWANQYIDDTAGAFGNGDRTMRRFMAISDGSPRVLLDSISALTYGFVNFSEIDVQKRSSLSSSYYFDNPYFAGDFHSTDGNVNWVLIQENIDYRSSKEIYDKYDLSYLIMDTKYPEPVFESVYEKKISVYDNSRIKIWIID